MNEIQTSISNYAQTGHLIALDDISSKEPLVIKSWYYCITSYFFPDMGITLKTDLVASEILFHQNKLKTSKNLRVAEGIQKISLISGMSDNNRKDLQALSKQIQGSPKAPPSSINTHYGRKKKPTPRPKDSSHNTRSKCRKMQRKTPSQASGQTSIPIQTAVSLDRDTVKGIIKEEVDRLFAPYQKQQGFCEKHKQSVINGAFSTALSAKEQDKGKIYALVQEELERVFYSYNYKKIEKKIPGFFQLSGVGASDIWIPGQTSPKKLETLMKSKPLSTDEVKSIEKRQRYCANYNKLREKNLLEFLNKDGLWLSSDEDRLSLNEAMHFFTINSDMIDLLEKIKALSPFNQMIQNGSSPNLYSSLGRNPIALEILELDLSTLSQRKNITKAYHKISRLYHPDKARECYQHERVAREFLFQAATPIFKELQRNFT